MTEAPSASIRSAPHFDYLLDPAPFLEAVKMVLDPQRGVLVIAVHDLRGIVLRRDASLS